MQRPHRLQTERSCDVSAVVANRVTRKFIMSEKQIYRKHAPVRIWTLDVEAACKWYSEADAGPGAEAGAGFRG